MAKLSKATLDDLKKSGFNLKAIEKMQIRDVSPDELACIFKTAYARIGMASFKQISCEVHATSRHQVKVLPSPIL